MRVKAVGLTIDGEEVVIGTFNQGLIVEENEIIDMALSETILCRYANGRWFPASQKDSVGWEIGLEPTPQFKRVFIQGAETQ